MINRELYEKEILDILCSGSRVAVVNGKPRRCSDIWSCAGCAFKNDEGSTCEECFAKWANSEYVESQVDWSKVAVDTPILVRENKGDRWIKRYFAKFEDGCVSTWGGGTTSWGNSDGALIYPITHWKYAKLAEEDSDGK